MGFWDMAMFVFLEAKMVNLGLIEFQLGLPLNNSAIFYPILKFDNTKNVGPKWLALS